MDEETIRVGDKLMFSKTVLEMLLKRVEERPDFPEGAVAIAGEVVSVFRTADGFVVPTLKRIEAG